VSFDRSLWLLSAFNDYLARSHTRTVAPPVDNDTLRALQPVTRNAPIAENARNDAQPLVESFRAHVMHVPDFEHRTLSRSEIFRRIAQPVFGMRSDISEQEKKLADTIALSRRYFAQEFAGYTDDERVEAERAGKPRVFERIYGATGQQYFELRGTIYDRVNDFVDRFSDAGQAALRDRLTSRYDAAHETLAPSTQPDISLEAARLTLERIERLQRALE
jgi:hypothetical protein